MTRRRLTPPWSAGQSTLTPRSQSCPSPRHHRSKIRLLVLGVAQRRKDGAVVGLGGLEFGQRAEGRAGPHFEENCVGILEQFPDAIGKTDALAQMPGPVVWIDRFAGRDPIAP